MVLKCLQAANDWGKQITFVFATFRDRPLSAVASSEGEEEVRHRRGNTSWRTFAHASFEVARAQFLNTSQWSTKLSLRHLEVLYSRGKKCFACRMGCCRRSEFIVAGAVSLRPPNDNQERSIAHVRNRKITPLVTFYDYRLNKRCVINQRVV